MKLVPFLELNTFSVPSDFCDWKITKMAQVDCKSVWWIRQVSWNYFSNQSLTQTEQEDKLQGSYKLDHHNRWRMRLQNYSNLLNYVIYHCTRILKLSELIVRCCVAISECTESGVLYVNEQVEFNCFERPRPPSSDHSRSACNREADSLFIKRIITRLFVEEHPWRNSVTQPGLDDFSLGPGTNLPRTTPFEHPLPILPPSLD